MRSNREPSAPMPSDHAYQDDRTVREPPPRAAPDLRKVGLNPDFWYPLAVARQLKTGKTLGVSFAGAPIVLARTDSGKVFALEDRCAHRQIPLHHGVVVGERLRCCYHAWSYSEDGTCKVPYLPEGAPAPHGVRTYPCRVAHGLIFVFPGDPARAATAPLPELPMVCATDYVTINFVRQINCHYTFLHENLMDMNHQFLHRRWMGRFKPTLLAVRCDRDRIEADYSFDFLTRRLDLRNALQALLGVRASPQAGADGAIAHGSDYLTVSTQYPYQSLQLRRPNIAEPTLALWVAYVSTDRDQKINRPCGVLMIRKPVVPWLAYVMRPMFRYFTDSIFEEDRFVLEAEQRAYDLQGGDWNQEVLPLIMNLRELLIANGALAEC
jgi:nitrite reductase/ring-hydroxylating ferredoxin subunit